MLTFSFIENNIVHKEPGKDICAVLEYVILDEMSNFDSFTRLIMTTVKWSPAMIKNVSSKAMGKQSYFTPILKKL